MNQCDGCARGLPLENGIHKGDGYDLIGCTADRYVMAEPLEPSELDAYLSAAQVAFTDSGGNINAAFAATEAARKSLEQSYLEGVAALVWRWREEATADESTWGGGAIAGVLRECADELANSLPARLVADAGKVGGDAT